jgi:hypothetical protein
MIYCDSFSLEQGIAPPQGDLPRPTWTKLIAQGMLLSNSIEYAHWTASPVEPIVCEGCWDATCARAGLARIVNLGDDLLWLPPRLRDIDEFWRDGLSEANFIRQPVVMPHATWERLRDKFPQLPHPLTYPRAVRRDLAGLWLGAIPEAVRVDELGQLEERLRHEVLASDPLDLEPAREVVRSMIGWLSENLDEPIVGRIVGTGDCGGLVNSLYFEGPSVSEWPAFVVGRDRAFVLERDWVFLTDEGSPR